MAGTGLATDRDDGNFGLSVMGNVRPRTPINEHADSVDVDEGTLSRTESLPPGTIGLKAKGGSQKQGGTTDPVTYARARLGQRVGNGECFTLVDRALRASGMQSAADYGPVTPDGDYVWGTAVSLSDLQPGDVIQFRDYRYEKTVVTETPTLTTTETEEHTRPHHTAIVERVNGGEVTVLEQNAPVGSPVRRTALYFESGTRRVGNRTITISVEGTLWYYRPQVP
jgi:hypothetical protein